MHDRWNIQTPCYLFAADSIMCLSTFTYAQRAPEEANDVVRYSRSNKGH